MMPQPVDSICDPRRIFITEIEILCSEFREKTSCPLTLTRQLGWPNRNWIQEVPAIGTGLAPKVVKIIPRAAS